METKRGPSIVPTPGSAISLQPKKNRRRHLVKHIRRSRVRSIELRRQTSPPVSFSSPTNRKENLPIIPSCVKIYIKNQPHPILTTLAPGASTRNSREQLAKKHQSEKVSIGITALASHFAFVFGDFTKSLILVETT